MNRIRYLDRAKISAIKSKMYAELLTWRALWCVPEFDIEVNLDQPRSIATNEANEYETWKVAGQSVSIDFSKLDWDALIFGENQDVTPDDELKDEIVAACRQDLILRLFSGDNADISQEESGSGVFHSGTFLRGSFESQFGGFVFLMGVGLVTDNYPSPKNRHTLAKIDDAIEATPCDIDVSIDFGLLDVNEIMSLKPGKIIKSNVNCFDPMSASLNGEHLFSGFIGKCQSKRVLVISE